MADGDFGLVGAVLAQMRLNSASRPCPLECEENSTEFAHRVHGPGENG